MTAAALQRPRAPPNGEYHRMENDNPAERFKNGMKMQLFGSIAIFAYPWPNSDFIADWTAARAKRQTCCNRH